MPEVQSRGAALELSGLTKSYGSVVALNDASLRIEAGEFVTFLGPSGSGKTTTLNLIAGFVDATAGSITMDATPIETMKPHKRDIGVVFQNYALFPHMTAAANIAFPLKQRKVPKADINRRVDEVLAQVGLDGMGSRYPRELSGGQQQRVAVARALVFRPRLMLMDEPLGALDKKLRGVLQLELKRLHREVGITFILVTHDQEEALILSDRIAVFNEGRVEQIGDPVEIYEHPRTAFVADFLGDSNILRGELDPDRPNIMACPHGAVQLDSESASANDRGPAAVVVRPERLRLVTDEAPADDLENTVTGTVVETVYLGASLKLIVEVGGLPPVCAHLDAGTELPRVGASATLAWPRTAGRLLADQASVTRSAATSKTEASPTLAVPAEVGN